MGIAVVIPTYDRAETLPRALDSVVAQTRAAEQIIVVDDGSHDETADIIADRYPEIILLRQPNRGVSAARNRGILAATQEWIAFLDSDDEWHPEKLARQSALAARHPRHRFVHCDETWIRNGRPLAQKKHHRKAGGWIFPQCLPLCAVSPSAAMVTRELLLEIGMFDETLPACEDYDLWLRICAAEPVLFVPAALVTKHGGHGDQLSRRVWGLDRFRIRALQKILDSGTLGREYRRLAAQALIAKVDIYVAGAQKRGRHREAAHYARLKEQVAKCSV